jgi:hypothetical protein
MLSRNQYTLIANALRDSKPGGDLGRKSMYQWQHDVVAVADALAYDSPEFRYDLFLDSCGWDAICPSCGGRLSVTFTCLSRCVDKSA